ncbi:hypothetical protein O181_018994 [Austropuccinia psidii MF-1]|uniref:Mannan endo-1,6-alpha-mannosidase n=1 Tax=Austropuccinia psidii MF-1 TaxID=1389203 RepID=A0A9Q3C683_9BASI|nr:hypothetical protein [Austropuccinia psidii MF-1]
MRLIYSIITNPLFIFAAQAASYSPALDPTNTNQLQKATSQALKNLLTYYTPNAGGVFDQSLTPWHESGMIWGMFMDYLKYTGDRQFLNLVTGALANASYNTAHDFLGGAQTKLAEKFLGRWNDDILWHSQVFVGGAEILGPTSEMPGAKSDWISLAVKTYEQVRSQTDGKCGGGIYWSRARDNPSGNYKSVITQLEFVSQGARNFLLTHDVQAFARSKVVLEWVISSSVGNSKIGILFDGLEADNCTKVTKKNWSYNYGQLLGSLAWMFKATKDEKYLDLTVPYFEYATQRFSPKSNFGVIAELCEKAKKKCNRDQQGFKAVYVRNLAYLYRETNNNTMRKAIKNMIDATLHAMVQRSCDKDWNCGGNWTQDKQPVKYVRSQHVSAALLVASLGIYTSKDVQGRNGSVASTSSPINGGLNSSESSEDEQSSAAFTEVLGKKWIAIRMFFILLLCS